LANRSWIVPARRHALLGVKPSARFCATLVSAAIVASVWLAPAARAHATAPTGGYAADFALRGSVEHPGNFTLGKLRQYPSSKVEVVFGAGAALQRGVFVGVSLWDLIREAGVKERPGHKNDSLRKYVLVTGSDGYQVTVALAEISPDFGGEVMLVAYQRDDRPLGPDEGMARLVVPHDKRGGRYVNNIVLIEVRDPD